ncbi:hypothetical protein C2857_000025 [Epichloe festucae Fl1]|uniref:Prolyl 4-hydroxylase alpha subunit domain-containing protein n=1 Tax=Epichloe festucae (strain Fl1) TaxID=877507 RepID=A0A7U3SN29_EPIFF|nr:hypothetical protein C2857_000025 [Epichloe festucae Fl1]
MRNMCFLQSLDPFLLKERYEVSRVWPDNIGYVYPEVRVSESAEIPVDDVVIRRIQKRARHFMGWRNANTTIQPMKTQRYGFNGFYTFHYDWVDFDSRFPGNRMTTFMVYVEDACTGGGTNFPRIPQPQDKRWCDVIACSGDEEFEDYPGVTFKPIAGSAIYWENFDANGNGHEATRHAALPLVEHCIKLRITNGNDITDLVPAVTDTAAAPVPATPAATPTARADDHNETAKVDTNHLTFGVKALHSHRINRSIVTGGTWATHCLFHGHHPPWGLQQISALIKLISYPGWSLVTGRMAYAIIKCKFLTK